ncbi:regulated potassium-efflux system protein KefC [Seminavis robusta]|uniref:Regulated potassium-efflux system protein KefC n=1 Tax=Seminavis robusta TaxID=568900 RepID=A0A9N8HBS9_9STRA|nr:regulated potassium-efflux system protein KefC [Seminavis robusta]|eukprot:Sro271_g104630.1 regulated potassium-efflux system protein KefC (832) ;mRNA; f:57821-60502
MVVVAGGILYFASWKEGMGNSNAFKRVLQEDSDAAPEGLSVDVSFEDILKTVIFLMTSWMMAVASQLVGLPSLVGEIVTGFILGPPLLDFVAYPEAMVLIGSFGLIGLLLDSGINLDIAQLRQTGSRAVLMAVTGTILALAVGLGMGHAANSGDFRSSFAVGAAFAPSSFGVASQVLSQGEILNTPMGQVIVAASVFDDILGLILLSIMEVLVKDSPKLVEYLVPFLSSFGYLLVLGLVGVTVFPKFVEHKILPRFREDTRDFVAFSLLFILLSFYLPLLHYSGASYLTGAFLAGLSFSQINSVHARYLRSAPHLKIWLMRIFFAATIGFQVPIQYFTDGNVLNWGFLYILPVLAKIPLGLLVPRFSRELPEDFPYDPYWRDVLITTLAMLCRGEFNFIVASFALSAGVLDPEQYAAVVFAILLSAIVAPLALSKTIRYYNGKFKAFLQSKHKLNRIDNTSDGNRPLFLAIQARTPVAWCLQEKFTEALESVGLIIIDHRSWHTLGTEAVVITEIFCQDKLARVRIRQAFKRSKSASVLTHASTPEDSPKPNYSRRTISTIKESPSRELLATMQDLEEAEEVRKEEDEISLRKQIVRDALIDCLGRDVDKSSYAIVVSQWDTFVFDDEAARSVGDSDDDAGLDRSRHAGYRFVTPAPSMKEPTQTDDGDGNADDQPPIIPSLDIESQKQDAASQEHGASSSNPRAPKPRRMASVGTYSDLGSAITTEDPKLDLDLWDIDQESHQVVTEGYFMAPIDDTGTQSVVEGCGRADEGRHHRRTASEDSFVLRVRRTHHGRTNSEDTFVLDESTLNEFDREVEAAIIKDRLRGYIR